MLARLRSLLLVCTLLVLALAALQLARHRVYQVDELENAYCVGVLARGEQAEVFTNAALFLIALRPIAATTLGSAQLLDVYRLVFLGLCFVNVALLFRITRLPVKSALGATVLLLAATLPSQWTFGYELRHDNVILLGLLLSLALAVTPRTPRRLAYVLLGAIAVMLQASAFKAFLYWVPLTAACLLFPHPAHLALHSRRKLTLHWLLGAGTTLALIVVLHLALGTWDSFTSSLRGGAQVAQRVLWHDHTPGLVHIAGQAPLLLVALVGIWLRVAIGFSRDGLPYASWSSALPAALVALGAFAIFLVNPTPFHYNFVPLYACLFLAGVHVLKELHEQLRSPGQRAALLTCVVLGHVVPFLPTAERLFAASNERQRTVMTLAERMTDRERDRVYAASGLVLTRRSIGKHWFLHSLNLQRFYDGTYPTVRWMLRQNPASVLIVSYRTDWLAVVDRKFMLTRYVPFADDFWVLGRYLTEGNGTFECVHPGRYFIQHGKSVVTLDGKRLVRPIQYLAKGPHLIASNSKMPVLVRWVGPRLRHLPKLPNASHHKLFAYDF